MVQTRASNKDKRVGLPDISPRLHDKTTTTNRDQRDSVLSVEARQEAVREIARAEQELLTHQQSVAATSRDPPGPTITKQPRPAAITTRETSKVTSSSRKRNPIRTVKNTANAVPIPGFR